MVGYAGYMYKFKLTIVQASNDFQQEKKKRGIEKTLNIGLI
jgi:hypothetical protein